MLRVELLDESLGQKGNIVLAVAKRRQRYRENIQPVEEIFAEFAILYGLNGIAIRRDDHPDIELKLMIAAQPPDLRHRPELAEAWAAAASASRRFRRGTRSRRGPARSNPGACPRRR